MPRKPGSAPSELFFNATCAMLWQIFPDINIFSYRYKEESIPEEWLKDWSAALEQSPAPKELHLPEKNMYIADVRNFCAVYFFICAFAKSYYVHAFICVGPHR
jgi:hypothetical protein